MLQATPLWTKTPLLHSRHLSDLLGANVYLKLDVFQPSQSYKYRGLSHFVQKAVQTHGPDVHCIVASGGNAGLATACAAKALGVKCTVFLPQGASPPTLALFKQEEAEVKEVGDCYQHALEAAQLEAQSNPKAVMIHAYDDPILWEGHASMIEESVEQLPQGVKPDAIVCCIGGGGLLGGIIVGCESAGWGDVPVIGIETHGSNCFYQSLSLNAGSFPGSPFPPQNGVEVVTDPVHDVKIARLPKLTSRAGSLGASWPSPGVVKMALQRKGGLKSVCVSDEMAMQTGLQFADEHKILVELACAATLTPAYSPELFNKLVPPQPDTRRTVVFIVCGGFKISVEELSEYQTILETQEKLKPDWEVWCNGEQWRIAKQ